MKQEHKLYAAVGALVVVVGLVFVVQSGEKKEAEAHSAAGETAELPKLEIKQDGISKIEIGNKDKGSVTLEKKGDKWEITAPVGAPANQSHIDAVLKNLEALSIDQRITDGAKSYDKYELSDGKSVHVVVFKGAEKVLDAHFGKSGGRGQTMRLAGQEAVYGVKGYSAFNYTREVKNWRHNEIIKFEGDNAINVTVDNEHGQFSFSKNGEDWAGTFAARDKDSLAKAKPIDEFDGAQVGKLVNAYKTLRSIDFAADGDDTGVADPLAAGGGIVRIKLRDGAGDYELKIGNKQKSNNRYVAKEGDATVYVISSWAGDWATHGVDKYQKKAEEEGDGEKDGAKDAKPATAGKAPAPAKAAPAPKAPPASKAPAAPTK